MPYAAPETSGSASEGTQQVYRRQGINAAKNNRVSPMVIGTESYSTDVDRIPLRLIRLAGLLTPRSSHLILTQIYFVEKRWGLMVRRTMDEPEHRRDDFSEGEGMRMRRAARTVIPIILTAIVAACASDQTKEEASAPSAAAAPIPASVPAPTATRVAPKPVPANPLRDPRSILAKRSVYYDLDSYVVKREFRPMVEAHAGYVKQHSSSSVVIEGNGDERGSREYNLALGQRRADAVKSLMVLLGGPERQIESVSFGEERPKAAGHDEAAWAQNRRSDIVYKKE